MTICVWSVQTYKKHTIETIQVSDSDEQPHGPFWTIDGDKEIAFRSGKDARSFVNGQRPRWGFVNLKRFA